MSPADSGATDSSRPLQGRTIPGGLRPLARSAAKRRKRRKKREVNSQRLADEHAAQILGYLRLSRVEHGLLTNFGAPKFEINKYAPNIQHRTARQSHPKLRGSEGRMQSAECRKVGSGHVMRQQSHPNATLKPPRSECGRQNAECRMAERSRLKPAQSQGNAPVTREDRDRKPHGTRERQFPGFDCRPPTALFKAYWALL